MTCPNELYLLRTWVQCMGIASFGQFKRQTLRAAETIPLIGVQSVKSLAPSWLFFEVL